MYVNFLNYFCGNKLICNDEATLTYPIHMLHTFLFDQHVLNVQSAIMSHCNQNSNTSLNISKGNLTLTHRTPTYCQCISSV